MDSRLRLANIFRWTARALSVLLILCTCPYLLFVGLQIPESGGVPAVFYGYFLLMAAMCVGLVVAWWKEMVGAGIALAALLPSVILTGAMPGFSARGGTSMLTGPLSLLMALIVSGYSPDRSRGAGVVGAAAWVLTLAPIALYFASWWLRRRPQAAE